MFKFIAKQYMYLGKGTCKEAMIWLGWVLVDQSIFQESNPLCYTKMVYYQLFMYCTEESNIKNLNYFNILYFYSGIVVKCACVNHINKNSDKYVV